MNKCRFFLFFILLIPINAFPNEKINIFLKDNNLKDKGEIAFTVCNEKSDEPLSYISVSVEKRLNDKWKHVRVDVECPCNAKCKKGFTKLQEGQCKDYSWDLIDGECKAAISGEYRFVIVDRWSDAIRGYLYLGASESFFKN